jgi:hypothetical protein
MTTILGNVTRNWWAFVLRGLRSTIEAAVERSGVR